MDHAQRKEKLSREKIRWGYLLAIIGAFSLVLFLPTHIANAQQNHSSSGSTALACTQQNTTISAQSLLVILLDRSGSLTYEPGATDPDGYSTSVTRALIDLWPGPVAVVPFSGTQTPLLGRANAGDTQARAQLKDEVANYPIGGDTPLAPALHQALPLFQQAAAGSRLIIITDGSPYPPDINGISQVDDINNHLVSQFCNQGIGIDTIGLALDLTQQDGQEADKLLNKLATQTGGVYKLVRNSRELSQLVIHLYANWQNLEFASISGTDDTHKVYIDTYAKKVIFLTFYANSQNTTTLTAPSGHVLKAPVITSSTDRHYEIDNMAIGSVNQAGAYTIGTQGASDPQVYALVETRLHAVLDSPTSRDTAYIGQPFQIIAELDDDTTPIVPKPSEVTINAQVSLTVNGNEVWSRSVELTQNKDSSLFSGRVELPGPAGQLHISLQASYLQAEVAASQAQVTIPLVTAPALPLKPSEQPCGINLGCYWQRNPVAVASSVPIILLALLLLLLALKQGPRGQLIQSGNSEYLKNINRPLSRKLFHKSTLTSEELEKYGGFDFNSIAFSLHFQKTGVTVHKTGLEDDARIKIKKGVQAESVDPNNKDGTPLEDGDVLLVGTCKPAEYKVEDSTHGDEF